MSDIFGISAQTPHRHLFLILELCPLSSSPCSHLLTPPLNTVRSLFKKMLCPSSLKVPISVLCTANTFFTLSCYINGDYIVTRARCLPSGLPRIMTEHQSCFQPCATCALYMFWCFDFWLFCFVNQGFCRSWKVVKKILFIVVFQQKGGGVNLIYNFFYFFFACRRH